jgi:hypothetical protein
MEIQGFCLNWHKNVSPAFTKFLVEPLSKFIKVTLDPWDGIELKKDVILDRPVIFCQYAPPVNWLIEKRAQIIWVPMWDIAVDIPQEFFNSLPKKNLKILAYSKHVFNKAQEAGINTLLVKYFMDVQSITPVNWDQPRTLFYWNRRGLIGPEFLKKLCSTIEIERIIFLKKIDPGIEPDFSYSLPPKIGDTAVNIYDELMPHSEYLDLLNQANIFIAPRLYEGVGISVLEALAKGCAVFSANLPTMNEYITHKLNGYLLPVSNELRTYFLFRSGRFIKRRINRITGKTFFNLSSISPYQNWKDISRIDLRQLSAQALESQSIGYQQWQKSLPEIADFITTW